MMASQLVENLQHSYEVFEKNMTWSALPLPEEEFLGFGEQRNNYGRLPIIVLIE